jgi:FAD/FMN-containing dehydrogenase
MRSSSETVLNTALYSDRKAAPCHVGDGNFHLVIVLNPNDPKEIAEAERINERPVHRALSLDGTGTGEHGIGCGKLV